MFKNVAGKIALQAFDSTTGAPKLGDGPQITVYVNKDWAGSNALTDSTATEIDSVKAPGMYLFDVLASEANADVLHFTGKSTTSGIYLIPVLVYTTPPNFTSLAIDAATGGVTIIPGNRPGIRKNVALPNFGIFLTDSTSHGPATGKTGISVTRSIDGGAFGAGTLTTPTEISGGWYKFDWAAADLNGDVILLRVTCAACDDVNIEIRTAP